MHPRLVLATASGALSAALPLLAVWAATEVADASDCEDWDCLVPFLATLAVGLPLTWVVWSTALHRLGQRLAWLVPPAAALTSYLVSGVLVPLPSPALGTVRGFPLLVLCAAGWAAFLGPRPLKGYGDLQRR